MPDSGAAGAPLAGKRGRVQIHGANITARQWQLKSLADIIDTTSFEDIDDNGETHEVSTDGVRRVKGTVVLFIDSDNLPNTTYALDGGALLTAVYLYVDKRLDDRRWTFPYIRVEDVDWGAEVKGGQECTVTFRGQGTYTGPA